MANNCGHQQRKALEPGEVAVQIRFEGLDEFGFKHPDFEGPSTPSTFFRGFSRFFSLTINQLHPTFSSCSVLGNDQIYPGNTYNIPLQRTGRGALFSWASATIAGLRSDVDDSPVGNSVGLDVMLKREQATLNGWVSFVANGPNTYYALDKSVRIEDLAQVEKRKALAHELWHAYAHQHGGIPYIGVYNRAKGRDESAATVVDQTLSITMDVIESVEQQLSQLTFDCSGAERHLKRHWRNSWAFPVLNPPPLWPVSGSEPVNSLSFALIESELGMRLSCKKIAKAINSMKIMQSCCLRVSCNSGPIARDLNWNLQITVDESRELHPFIR